MQNKIIIASAVLLNENGDLLTVRKRNSAFYMLPGGKLDNTETPIEALIRELKEELDIELKEHQFQFLGKHTTAAANEIDTTVEGNIFVCKQVMSNMVQCHAEIEEAYWLTKASYKQFKLAHLLAEYVVPKWLNELI